MTTTKCRLVWPCEPDSIQLAIIEDKYMWPSSFMRHVKRYDVPPLHWNRYTREGRDLLRSLGFTIKEAYLHDQDQTDL
jgi:hypothetical protein